ncbi:MAG: FKBP-type peptidyl-prolyl cis-trans isomerase [Crocinitomicaceae bacterium]|nr:FKBP-type peptidyl-prolyl cis-trans isomerase [Crocinitomicaceae bacterium]
MKGTRCFYLLLILMVVSCQSKKEEVKVNWTQEQSSNFGKELAFEEDMNIRMYLDQRKSWKVEETGSGLRYYIYQKGNGPFAESGMTAKVRFKITLLTGETCYETKGEEVESFKIDKSDIETGVQEGIKKMRVGDKAKLIIPSHLGHGLAGDFDKIPPLTTIVVDLELISLKIKR